MLLAALLAGKGAGVRSAARSAIGVLRVRINNHRFIGRGP